MIIGYHYHIPGIIKNNKFYTSAQQGLFIETLSTYVKKIICYLHFPNDDDLATMDYIIENKNVVLINIGNHDSVYNRTIFPEKYLNKINPKDFDILFLRGPSPLVPYLLFKYKTCLITLLIVGDYSKEHAIHNIINFKKLIIYFWSKIYNIFQDYFVKKHLLLLNNKWQYKDYLPHQKNIGLVSTSLMSKVNYYKRIDTCNNKRKNILFVGRIDKNKGIVDISKAVIYLVSKNVDVMFNIVGYENIEDNIIESVFNLFKKNKIAHLIKFHGHVPFGDTLFKYYRDADIFVNASRSNEGFPRTLWESFSQCLPVVTTNVGGIGYTIVNEKNALFFDARSYKSMALNIQKLIDNQNLRRSIIKNSFQLAMDNSFETNIDNTFNIINSYYKRKIRVEVPD